MAEEKQNPAVFYDGECALCRNFVASVDMTARSELNFVDIKQGTLPTEIAPAAAEREIHFRDEQGKLHRNVDAIIEIWKRNGTHLLLRRILTLPIIHGVAVLAYRVIAAQRFRLSSIFYRS